MHIRGPSFLCLWLLSLGTAAPACSPAIADYPLELEEAVCAWQHKCHQFERPGDCVDARTIDSDPQYDYLARAIAAGNIEYDADAASDCLDAIRERSCDDDAPGPEVCDRVFRGLVGRNAPCLIAEECAGNAVCGFHPDCGEDQCCPGACRVFADPLAVGEPCTFGGTECAPESFCARDPETFLPTVCTALVEVGGACSRKGQCVEGADCDGDGKCRALELRQPGEPCEGLDVVCAAPGVCSNPDDGVGPICMVPGELGAPCGSGCTRFDTFCDQPSGLCTLLPGPGQACADGYRCLDYADCRPEAYDRFFEPVGDLRCVARPGLGESCRPSEVEAQTLSCLGELVCDEAGRCVLPPLVGEQCDVPTD